ncbi:MAG TPA: hypothetical protein DCM68_07575 [Verrucomicrobia bacterium]|nr:hypothetical protein [Verrucomicrobiota bacterium]
MAILVVLMFAVPAMGQLGGMPIASDAATPDVGQLRGLAGVVIGDDANIYGGRLSFAPVQGLTVFGDLGAIDFDAHGIDLGWAVQGGGLFTLPVKLPVDLALRGTLGMAMAEGDGADITWTTLNGGVLASKKIEMLTPYGFLGLNYGKYEVEAKHGGGDYDDDETDLALGGGVLFSMNEQISFYGEIGHVDDVFFGVGGRFAF